MDRRPGPRRAARHLVERRLARRSKDQFVAVLDLNHSQDHHPKRVLKMHFFSRDWERKEQVLRVLRFLKVKLNVFAFDFWRIAYSGVSCICMYLQWIQELESH